MEIFMSILWVLVGLVLLYYGAEWLVQGSSELALKAGISPLVVGLTVVAFGTSAPELLVSVSANLKEPPQGDFALGNVVGSNICNLALVLGIGALIKPLRIHRQVLRREMPILLVATVVFAAMLYGGVITRWEGLLLFAGVVTYTAVSIRMSRKGGIASEELELTPEEVAEICESGAKRAVLDVLLMLGGLIALVVGADRLVLGGGTLAGILGVPEAVIALSLVAFGTSLPEVATTVVASLKGKGDLAVGNAVGSCIFNLLAVIGLTGAIAPLSAEALQMSDLIVMAAITFLILPLMYTRRALGRLEGGLLAVVYVSYVIWLYLRQG
jgi:cation:H+ antiporter